VLNAGLRDLVAAVRAQGLEGLVAKRLDSRYEPGKRSGAWQKMPSIKAKNSPSADTRPAPRTSMRSFLAITKVPISFM
jgi:bifunctional non-homologous end joining protein LigD